MFYPRCVVSRCSGRPLFSLTGTALHTNLGSAVLAESAIEAATAAMREAVALECLNILAQGREAIVSCGELR
jgi:seryl-tRNA(Sec) selenium transferase